MRNIMTILSFCVYGLVLAGCNTTRGVGEDIQAAGETIEDVAEDARDRLND